MGKRVSKEFLSTFTKYTTLGQGVELRTSNFENSNQRSCILKKNTYIYILYIAVQKKKQSHFPGPPVWRVTGEVPTVWVSAQKRPLAFFRFTCFQVGRALYSSLVISRANCKNEERGWWDGVKAAALHANTTLISTIPWAPQTLSGVSLKLRQLLAPMHH